MSAAYRLARPFLFAVDPEAAHRLAIRALATGFVGAPPPSDPRLGRRLLGIQFPSILGMAAGFDKNAEVPDRLLGLGFGFVELGTVTPLAQPGNRRPRMFRLTADRAVINRLGFNNEGHAAVHARLSRRSRNGVVGVNLGANKDSADRIADYVAGIERFADVADYLTINVSSPNTPGLRRLQEQSELAGLLDRVAEARRKLSKGSPPVLLKIAPDLDDDALAAIADAALAAAIDGIIVSNTTVARDGLKPSRHAREEGGLSGQPLFGRSTVMLAKLRQRLGGRMVLIGVGGVDSGETAFAKIAAGADLVQLYTGMVYRGPGLPACILRDLIRMLESRGLASIADAVGLETDRWAAMSAVSGAAE
jgi:dihydroorotate dehydrogenase